MTYRNGAHSYYVETGRGQLREIESGKWHLLRILWHFKIRAFVLVKYNDYNGSQEHYR